MTTSRSMAAWQEEVGVRPDAPAGRRQRRRLAGLLVVVLCLAAFIAAAQVATVVFDRVPHWEDEVAYIFQARTIASGQIVADAPARPEFFESQFVIVHDGKWFGKYPPGYPAVLALGVPTGQLWLINPLVGALTVGLIYLAGCRLYGTATGLLAAALTVVSPFFLLQAGSFLSHVVCLFWAVAFLHLFQTVQRQDSYRAAFAAGLVLGVLFLSRPLTAVGLALPYALWTLVDSWRARRRAGAYLVLLGAFLLLTPGLPAYNYLTTGDLLRSAYELWWPHDRIGFGEGIGVGGHHTLADGLAKAGDSLAGLADYLFGWPYRLSVLPPLVAALLAVVSLIRGNRRRRVSPPAGDSGESQAAAGAPAAAWDLLHVGVLVSLVAVHVAYWYGGQMYGPRYYFEALGGLALLSARGLLHIAAAGAMLIRRATPAGGRAGAWALLATMLVVSGLTAHGFATFAAQEFRHYTHWYGITGTGIRQVQAAGLTHAVVFVGEPPTTRWTVYAPFFVENAPTLDGEVIYALDLGDERNRDLMALYPGRAYYRYSHGRLVPLGG